MCTSSATLREVVTLRTSPQRRWSLLTSPTSPHAPDSESGDRGLNPLRTRAPERRRILKKESIGIPQTSGCGGGSHVPLDGWSLQDTIPAPSHRVCYVLDVVVQLDFCHHRHWHPNPRGLHVSTDYDNSRVFTINLVSSVVRVGSIARDGLALRTQPWEANRGSQHPSTHCHLRSDGWPDGALLYYTLVADKALLSSFLPEFLRLSSWITAAPQRQAAQLAAHIRSGCRCVLALRSPTEEITVRRWKERPGAFRASDSQRPQEVQVPSPLRAVPRPDSTHGH